MESSDVTRNLIELGRLSVKVGLAIRHENDWVTVQHKEEEIYSTMDIEEMLTFLIGYEMAMNRYAQEDTDE